MSFGSKKMKDQNDESLNALEAVVEEESRNVQQEVSVSNRGSAMTCALLSPTKKTKDLNWDDSIGYFIKNAIWQW